MYCKPKHQIEDYICHAFGVTSTSSLDATLVISVENFMAKLKNKVIKRTGPIDPPETTSIDAKTKRLSFEFNGEQLKALVKT